MVNTASTTSSNIFSSFNSSKQYAYYDVVSEYMHYKLKDWTPPGAQFVHNPNDLTKLAFILTADSQIVSSPTAAESYSNTSFVFRGRNSAVLFANDILAQNQLDGDGFNFVVSLGFNIIHHVKNNAQLTSFCSATPPGYSTEIKQEPIYELTLGAATMGIYHEILTCTSTDTKTTRLSLIGQGTTHQFWDLTFGGGTDNKNYSFVFSFEKNPLSEHVKVYYSVVVQNVAAWTNVVTDASFTISPGALTVDSLKHGLGNIKKTTIPAGYISVFEYEFVNIVTTTGGRAQPLVYCDLTRGAFDSPSILAQNYAGNPPISRPVLCSVPAYELMAQGCINRGHAQAPAAIPNCVRSYPAGGGNPSRCGWPSPGFFPVAPNSETCAACTANCYLCQTASSCLHCNTGYIRTASGANFICSVFTPGPTALYVPAYQSQHTATPFTMPAATEVSPGVFTSEASVPLTTSGTLFVQIAIDASSGFGAAGGNYDVQLYLGFTLIDVSTLPVLASGATYTHLINAYKYSVSQYDQASLTFKIQAGTAFTVLYGLYTIKLHDLNQVCAMTNSANECLLCNRALAVYTAENDVNKCTGTVPNGYYMVPQYPGKYDAIALCSTGCGNCAGSSTNCTTCPSSQNLISDLGDPSYSRCVATCPDGWYNDNGRCRLCHTTCSTCDGASQSSCTTCHSTRSLSSLNCAAPSRCCYVAGIANCDTYSGDSTCNTCISGYQKVNNKCAESTQYNSPTAQCKFVNPEPGYNCYECNVAAGYYLPSATAACLAIPPGQYVSASNFGVSDTLSSCDSSPGTDCATCVTTATTCTTCANGKFLSVTSCVATCPTDQGPNSSNVCVNCFSRCSECAGTASNECTACKAGFAASTIGCNPAAGRSCCYAIDQVPNCLTPSADNVCSVCEPAHTKVRGYCVPDASLATTNPCVYELPGPVCKLCNWDMGYYMQSAGNCVLIPAGFVPSQGIAGGTDNLQPCISGCASCSVTAQNCLSCSPGFFESPSSPSNGPKVCISPCPPAFYGNSTSGKCQACHSSCSTCSGSQAKDCLTCAVGSVATTKTSSCESTTPSTCCVKCAVENCKQCSDDNVCQSCLDGFELEGTKCKSTLTAQNKLKVLARFNSLDASYELVFAEPVKLSLLKNVAKIEYKVSLFTVTFNCFDQETSAKNCASKVRFLEGVEVNQEDIKLVIQKPVVVGENTYIEAQTVQLDRPISYFIPSEASAQNVVRISQTMSTVGTVSTTPMLAMNGNSFSGFIRLTQTIEFLLYLNIIFPSNYKNFVHYFSEGIFDLAYNPFDSLSDNANSNEVMGWTFLENQLRERYLMNAGQFVVIVGILAAIKLIFMLTARLSKNSTGCFGRISKKANDTLNTNMAFNLFESAFVDFAVASIINLKYGNFSSLYDSLNYGLGIFTTLLLCLEIGFVWHYSYIMHRDKPVVAPDNFDGLLESAPPSPTKGMMKVRLHKQVNTTQIQGPDSKPKKIYSIRATPSEIGLKSLTQSKEHSKPPMEGKRIPVPHNFHGRAIQLYTWANLEDLLNPEDAQTFSGRYRTLIGQLKAFLTVLVLVFTFEYPIVQVGGTLLLQLVPTVCFFLNKPHKALKDNFKTFFTETMLSLLMVGCTLMLPETGLLQSPRERYHYMGSTMIGLSAAVFLYAVLSGLYDAGKTIFQYFSQRKKSKVTVLPSEPANLRESSIEGMTPFSRGSMNSSSAMRPNFTDNHKMTIPASEGSKFRKLKINQSRLSNIQANPDKSGENSPKSPDGQGFSTKNSLETKEANNRPSLKKPVVVVQPGPAFIPPPKSPLASNTLHPGFSTISGKPSKRKSSRSPRNLDLSTKKDSPNDSTSPKSPNVHSVQDKKQRLTVSNPPNVGDGAANLESAQLGASSTSLLKGERRDSSFSPLKATPKLSSVAKVRSSLREDQVDKSPSDKSPDKQSKFSKKKQD